MTIDEAIEEQKRRLTTLNVDIPYKVRDAMRLGIEALKRVKEFREEGFTWTKVLLIGETKK